MAPFAVFWYPRGMTSPTPGVYRKGHETRVADTAAQAVQLAFDGYQRETAEAVAAELDRPALQARAKELGIKANQSSEALAEQIAAHVPQGDEVASGGERPSPDLSYVSGLGDGTDEVEGYQGDGVDHP